MPAAGALVVLDLLQGDRPRPVILRPPEEHAAADAVCAGRPGLSSQVGVGLEPFGEKGTRTCPMFTAQAVLLISSLCASDICW